MEGMILTKSAIEAFAKHIKNYLYEVAKMGDNEDKMPFDDYIFRRLDDEILCRDNINPENVDLFIELMKASRVNSVFTEMN